jgi:hypothetical protein
MMRDPRKRSEQQSIYHQSYYIPNTIVRHCIAVQNLKTTQLRVSDETCHARKRPSPSVSRQHATAAGSNSKDKRRRRHTWYYSFGRGECCRLLPIHSMAALRSVSFVDLDWAVEEEKLRARVNRLAEKKKQRHSNNKNRRKKRITMSTQEQVQVTAFLSDIAATTTSDVALEALCAMDSAQAFLTQLEPPPSLEITMDRDKVDFCNDCFDRWKDSNTIFPKALEWMTLAIQQRLYTSRSLSISSSSSSSGSSHGNDDDVASLVHGLSIFEEIPVDAEKAKKFQWLLDAAGFDCFVLIEEAVNKCMDSDDKWTPASEPVIQDFLDTMEREKKNAKEEDKDQVDKYHEEMVSWFGRHAENHSERLRFLHEIFFQYRAVVTDGGDVQSSTGGGTVAS